MGFEPTGHLLAAYGLANRRNRPLCQSSDIWCEWGESNSLPRGHSANIIPKCFIHHCMVGQIRFELMYSGFSVRRLDHLSYCPIVNLVEPLGIEPSPEPCKGPMPPVNTLAPYLVDRLGLEPRTFQLKAGCC